MECLYGSGSFLHLSLLKRSITSKKSIALKFSTQKRQLNADRQVFYLEMYKKCLKIYFALNILIIILKKKLG